MVEDRAGVGMGEDQVVVGLKAGTLEVALELARQAVGGLGVLNDVPADSDSFTVGYEGSNRYAFANDASPGIVGDSVLGPDCDEISADQTVIYCSFPDGRRQVIGFRGGPDPDVVRFDTAPDGSSAPLPPMNGEYPLKTSAKTHTVGPTSSAAAMTATCWAAEGAPT